MSGGGGAAVPYRPGAAHTDAEVRSHENHYTRFLYQGLLDLHGWLYSPNAGEKIGHLPADNFLDFVQAVTTDIVKASGNEAEELPYTLEIVPPSSPIPRA
eukprot:6640733-Prymnesium_polylepis.1